MIDNISLGFTITGMVLACVVAIISLIGYKNVNDMEKQIKIKKVLAIMCCILSVIHIVKLILFNVMEFAYEAEGELLTIFIWLILATIHYTNYTSLKVFENEL